MRWCCDDSAPRTALYQGDIRSGKTYGAALALTVHSTGYRNKDFILGGQTATSVIRNVVPKMEEAAYMLWLPYKQVGNVLHIGANRFHIFGSPHSMSYKAVQGMDAAGALIDEATLCYENFIQQCIARCSEPGARIFLTFNPENPSHFLKRDWIDAGSVEHTHFNALIGDALDSGTLSQDAYDLYASTLTAHRRRRWLNNEWCYATGRCLPSLEDPALFPDRALLIADSPQFVKVVAGVDWGTASPTAAVFAGKRPDGKWQTCGEYFWDPVTNVPRTAEEHAAAIIALGEQLGCTRYAVDPSASTLKISMRRLGATVRNGWNEDLNERITQTDQAIHQGAFVITPDVPNLIREAGVYSWKDHDGPDVPNKVDDTAATQRGTLS